MVLCVHGSWPAPPPLWPWVWILVFCVSCSLSLSAAQSIPLRVSFSGFVGMVCVCLSLYIYTKYVFPVRQLPYSLPSGEYPLYSTPSSLLSVSLLVRIGSGYISCLASVWLSSHFFPFLVLVSLGGGVGLVPCPWWAFAVFSALVWCSAPSLGF